MVKLMPVKEVAAVTNQCRTMIFKQVKAGKFPPPVQISPCRIAWRSDLVEKWIEERPFAASKKGGLSDGK